MTNKNRKRDHGGEPTMMFLVKRGDKNIPRCAGRLQKDDYFVEVKKSFWKTYMELGKENFDLSIIDNLLGYEPSHEDPDMTPEFNQNMRNVWNKITLEVGFKQGLDRFFEEDVTMALAPIKLNVPLEYIMLDFEITRHDEHIG